MRYTATDTRGALRLELPAEILACDLCGDYRRPVRSYVVGRVTHPLSGRAIRVDACLSCRLHGRVEDAQAEIVSGWNQPATFYPVEIG